MAYETLEQAARQLTPGLLVVGTDPSLRECFMVAAFDQAGITHLHLDPVASPPQVGARATVNFRWNGVDYRTVVDVVESGTSRCVVRVRREPEVRPARPGRMAASSVTCSFLFAKAGLQLVAPVRDIGARGLSLESTSMLPVGSQLDHLTVRSGNRVLCHVEGVVSSSTPLLRACGATVWRCGVRLRRTGEAAPFDQAHRIRDLDRVSEIYWSIADVGAPLQVRVASSFHRLVNVSGHGSRAGLPELRGTAGTDVPDGVAEVSASLFFSTYRFSARIRHNLTGDICVIPGAAIRETHRREEERLDDVTDAKGTVAYTHPVDGRRHHHPLLNLSADGAGFSVTGDEAAWPDLPLLDMQVSLDGCTWTAPTGHVRSVSDGRCGVSFEGMADAATIDLRRHVLHGLDAAVELHDGTGLEEIAELHKKVDLLCDDMRLHLSATWQETRRTWQAAHQHELRLMQTATGRWQDKLASTACVVRAYDNSWMIQHNASVSPLNPVTPGRLKGLLLSSIIPRLDCDFLGAYMYDGGDGSHGLMDPFYASSCPPEHRGVSRLVLYAADVGGDPPSGADLRMLHGDAEVLVQRAAQRLFEPLVVQFMNLQPGHVWLPASRADWGRAGLERGRVACGAYVKGRLVAVMLREFGSPGLSLSGLLSTGFLLPVEEGTEAARVGQQALVHWLRRCPVPGNSPVRFLFTPRMRDPGVLLEVGMRHVHDVVLHCLHRHGMRELKRYVAARYGTAHALLNRAQVQAG